MGDLIFCCFVSVVSLYKIMVFSLHELSYFFRGACVLFVAAAAASSCKQQAAAAWNDNGDVTERFQG